MFDIGWLEMLIIGIVALIVVGPKDLPGMFRTVGQFMGKARGMAREFQRTMEAAADDSGLKEATKDLKTMTDPLGSAKSKFSSALKPDLDDDDTKPIAQPMKAKAGAPAAPAAESPTDAKETAALEAAKIAAENEAAQNS